MSAFAVGATILAMSGASALAQSWTGATGDDKWTTAGNWNPNVPATDGNVFIESAAHPIVHLDVDTTIGNLTLTGYALLEDDDYRGSSARNLFVQGTTTINKTQPNWETGVDITSGTNFRLGTLANFSNGTLTGYYSVYDNDGTASNLPTRIQFRGANVITNNAFVLIDGADAAIVDQDTGQNAFRNLAASNNQLYAGSAVVMTFPGNFTNTGDIYVYDELATPTNRLTVNGTFLNSGLGAVYVSAGGDFRVTGDFDNDITNFNGGIFLDNKYSPFPGTQTKATISGNLLNRAGGDIDVNGLDNPARLTVTGNLTNYGFIRLKGMGSLDVGGVLTQAGGEIRMEGATTGFETFKMTAERIDLAAGTRFGARGTLFADLVDKGIFAPGASPGLVTINGDLTFTKTAKLEIEIAGLTAGTEFDRIDQITRPIDTGTILGGTLAVAILNGFVVNNSNTFAIISSDRPLTGAFANAPSGGRISTSDGSGNFLVTYAGQNAVTLSGFLTGPLPLQLTGAFSRKMHGALGPFDLPLPLTTPVGVECRSSGGNHAIMFTFSNDVVSGSATLTAGVGSVSGIPTFVNNTMTVNLTGVADVQKITVSLSNVTDSFAQVLPSAAVSMNLLSGDTTGDKTVNSGDIAQTKAQSGASLTDANFRQDVTVDGGINSGDISLVKSRSGTGLP